ncbi:MAG: carbohydrate ABC transporter substrate-binding protein [Lachnospiraceae bacterium]|jgi:multiple sugar transport system substrate-binding protein|nr:carbohydrate ABC transporter substrate-binding protein [Lachnospiraceae bacterium]MCI8995532.1 carbohydrate ABC transporter substrate-binding protein [Lachnospiraceae bacterium]MCI9132591.1 carbohydrate ABC transporter substrate-binding protein [Lachnospiraceae bacterium]
MKKMRKMLALLLCVGMILGLAACGSKEEPAAAPAPADGGADQKTEEAPAAGGEQENVTLEVCIVQPDWSDEWDEMEKKFEDEYPWIDVVSVGVQENQGEFLTTRAAANDLPAVTQINNNPNVWALSEEGKILDASSFGVSANVPDSYKDAYTHDGVFMGITQGAAFTVLFLNMDILKQAGWEAPPTNFDELIKCCEDIEAKTDVAAITVAANKTTNCWMVWEGILANVYGDELGFGVYDEQIKDGTFDFTKNSKATEMLAAIASHMMTGTSSMTEDDVTAAFADGNVAMAIAGNWTAANICDAIGEAAGDPAAAAAVLVPFNEAGKDPWISVSPEDAFACTVQDDPKVAEAAGIFYEWVFQPDNFKIIQNARGTVPVLTNMTDEHIVLPDAVAKIVPAMNEAQYVMMSFNLLTSEFYDSSCTALKDVYSGNAKAEDAVASMAANLKESHLN